MNTTINAVCANKKDSCVTVVKPILKGQTVRYYGTDNALKSVVAGQDIPVYHKVAILEIKKDDEVIKYGEQIGVALADILPGNHVHVHNIRPLGRLH